MSALKLAVSSDDPRPAPEGPGRRDSDAVDSWLIVLMPTLSMPDSQRIEIRDELHDHLRQRVRDLMLTGVSEPVAMTTAIGELGDAASLAKQLNEARRRPQRRTAMAMIMGLTGISCVLAVAAVSVNGFNGGGTWPWAGSGVGAGGVGGVGGVGIRVFQPAPTADVKTLDALRVSAKETDTIGDFFKAVGEAARMPVTIHWSQLRGVRGDEFAVQHDTTIGMTFSGITLVSAMSLINDTLSFPADDGLQWRVIDGSVVFSSSLYFDRLETTMVTYDLSGVPNIEVGGEAGTQASIREAIVTMAFPEFWRDNGGDRATIREIGTTMLIKAPRRVHAQVEWIITNAAGKATKPHAALNPGMTPGLPIQPSLDEAWKWPFPNVQLKPPVLADLPTITRFFTAPHPDREPSSVVIELRHMKPEDFRAILASFYDVVPGMKQCPFPRVMECNDANITVSASKRQTDIAKALAEIIDRPASDAPAGTPGAPTADTHSQRFVLKYTEARAVAGWLNDMFQVSPYLHASPVPRSIAADVTDNSVIFGSIRRQVRSVEDLIALIDQRDPSGPPLSEYQVLVYGEPRVVSLERASAATLAPLVAASVISVAQQTGKQILVIAHASENSVVIAGDSALANQAERLTRALDQAIGKAAEESGLNTGMAR